jgi:hypothetical protein
VYKDGIKDKIVTQSIVRSGFRSAMPSLGTMSLRLL